MKLYLVRHGEAVSELEDPERPLTAKGKCDIGYIAGFLEDKRLPCSQVYCSEKIRAQQTAGIIAEKLTPHEEPITLPIMSPDGDLEALLAMVEEWTEDTMLVSHLPFLPTLLNKLLFPNTANNMGAFLAWSPGTVVCVKRQDSQWLLSWMVKPEFLKEG